MVVNISSFISNRREVRVLVLQTLCEFDSVGHDPLEVLSSKLVENEVESDFKAFAYDIVQNVLENFSLIGTIIGKLAPEWPLMQIAVVDRNILRMAIAELEYHEGDTPIKAVINEAVELAKRFGSESSPSFINGVLGTYLKMEITI